jgi:hypothetical protein
MMSFKGSWLRSGFKSEDLDDLAQRVQVELSDRNRQCVCCLCDSRCSSVSPNSIVQAVHMSASLLFRAGGLPD